MESWKTANDVLDFAIDEEEAAVEFYTRLAEQADEPAMRDAYLCFAQEERGHKAKLLAVKAGEALVARDVDIPNLKIADYVIDVEPSPDMTYQEALVVAMKKEKAAFKLYSDLAACAKDENIKATLLGLAQEEAKHKLRFEIEYDDLLDGA